MTEPPGESAEDCAVDGLLEELGRAGTGHDERFVSGVLTRVKAESGFGVSRVRRRWFIAGGAAAAAGLAIGLLGVIPHGEAHAFLLETQREVLVMRDGQRMVGHAGMSLRDSDEILAEGFFSAATLRYGTQPTVLRLGENGRLRLGVAGREALELTSGQVRVTAQGPPSPRVTIVTPHARATARATAFTISARADGTRLDVQHGSVDLQRRDQPGRHTVASGQFGEIAHGALNAGTPSPAIAAFHLIDADNGKSVAPFSPLENDRTISLSALGGRRVTIVATVVGIAGSVVFRSRLENGDIPEQVEENPPYTLTGNRPVVPGQPIAYDDWRPSPGRYQIEAVPFSGDGARGTPGPTVRLRIIVVP